MSVSGFAVTSGRSQQSIGTWSLDDRLQLAAIEPDEIAGLAAIDDDVSSPSRTSRSASWRRRMGNGSGAPAAAD